MNIKIKLLEGGKMPTKKTDGAAAYDCFARSVKLNQSGDRFTCKLGFAIELPQGYCAKIIARSSIVNTDLMLSNNIGLIDSDYRGEITAVFDNMWRIGNKFYQIGDRVCQMLIEKVEPTTLVEVEELSDTERGNGGYGSTGR